MTVTLYHGDCLEILKTLDAGSIDAVVTDPPYGVGLAYNSHDDSVEQYFRLMIDFMDLALPIINGGLLALTPGMKHLNWWYAEYPPDWTLAWFKSNQCSRNPFGGFNTWEPILFYGKSTISQDAFNRPIRHQEGVGNHPCPKDLGSWKTLIDRLGISEGATILDPFMGSGTTGVAAVQTGRNFIGIEIDENYYNIACKRIADAQAQMRMAI
jgi:site-specific DNA-methyltransferase (adenine-specific)